MNPDGQPLEDPERDDEEPEQPKPKPRKPKAGGATRRPAGAVWLEEHRG